MDMLCTKIENGLCFLDSVSIFQSLVLCCPWRTLCPFTMPKNLPHKLQHLFAPRPPLEHLPPPTSRKMPAYTGIGALVSRLKAPEDAPAPSSEPIEILKPSEIREKKRKRAIEEHELETVKKAKLCTPYNLSHLLKRYNT